MSMWLGLLVGVVFGVRRRERKRRQGREAWVNGLKVVRREVIVLRGIDMVMVLARGEGQGKGTGRRTLIILLQQGI